LGRDRYAGEWPREAFRKCGVEYRVSDQPKSDLYLGLLPLLNSGRVELLDHQRLVAQLCGLERRTFVIRSQVQWRWRRRQRRTRSRRSFSRASGQKMAAGSATLVATAPKQPRKNFTSITTAAAAHIGPAAARANGEQRFG